MVEILHISVLLFIFTVQDSVTALKSAILVVFTPQKLANTNESWIYCFDDSLNTRFKKGMKKI